MIEAGSDRCKLARVDSPDCAVRQPIITDNFIISNLSVKENYFIISFLSVEKALISARTFLIEKCKLELFSVSVMITKKTKKKFRN